MPFLLAEILNFQGSTHLIGVGSLSILYLNSVGFPVFFLDVDHTEKSCLSVSGTSAGPAHAAHKIQGQQGN